MIKKSDEPTASETNEYRTVFENAPDGIFLTNRDGHILKANDACVELWGIDRSELSYISIQDLIDAKYRQKIIESYAHLFENGVFNEEVIFQKKDGTKAQTFVSASRLSENRCVNYIKDVSAGKQLERELRENEAILAKAQEIAHIGNWIWDLTGDEMRWSDEMYRLFGLKPREATPSIELLEQFIHEEDTKLFQETFDNTLRRKKKFDLELRFTRFDGFERFGHMQFSIGRNGAGEAMWMIGTLQDITERKRMEQKLAKLSFLDGLTGIPNRRSFDRFIEREWNRSIRNFNPLSLILCDIDYFKNYNDTYGHQSGDDCLIQVAKVIHKNTNRVIDIAARYGGEEFVVALPETDNEGAVFVAEKIRQGVESLQVPHVQSKTCDHVTISLGVATTIPRNPFGPEILIETADQTLYQAKQNGRNRLESTYLRLKPI